MRNHDATLLTGCHCVREIRHVAANLARLKRGEHVLLVHEHVPRCIDDDDAVLHHGYRLGVDHALRRFERGHVNRDEVARLVNRLNVLAVLHGVVEVPRGVDRQVGVVAIDLHAELNRRVRDLLTDCAKPDDAEFLALNLRAGERLLRLLRRLADRRVRRVRLHPLNAADDVAAREQHRGNHEFLHAVRIRPRRVEHDDALLRVFGVGDVVHARTRTGDRQQILAGHEFVHLRRTDERGIRVRKVLRPGIVVGQVLQPHVRNRIEARILVVCHFLFFRRVYHGICRHA